MQFQNGSKFSTSRGDIMFNPISGESYARSWLITIESLAKDGSIESRETVNKLAEEELPGFESLPPHLRDAVNKIKELAQSKDWDFSLSPKTSKLLRQISQDHSQSEVPKPNCVRKLEFF
jgi:hypothetical protein